MKDTQSHFSNVGSRPR